MAPTDSALGLTARTPTEAAGMLASADASDEWLDAFMQRLSALRSSGQLGRVLEVWGLSQAEFADLVGVSRQAVGKWLDRLPSERQVLVANLAAATDLLTHYVRRERIPAVVRRRASALGDRSLVELIAAGQSDAALEAVRQMFDPAGAMG